MAMISLSGCTTATKSGPAAALPAPALPPATLAVAIPPPEKTPPASPAPPAAVKITPADPVEPAVPESRHATIKGTQEASILLDNFTAFVATVDGKKVAAGRRGWDAPLELMAGRRRLGVEFNRGVFVARAELELEAAADAKYELRYTTDAELFGRNSYCNFWIVDLGAGRTVTAVQKSSVEKSTPPQPAPILP